MNSIDDNSLPWYRNFLGRKVRVVLAGVSKKEIVIDGNLIFWDKISKALVLDTKEGYLFVRHYLTMFSQKGGKA